MTTIAQAYGQHHQSDSLLTGLRRAWRTYRTYRDTQAQLHRLSIREREDIGLAGEDLDAVARDAAARTAR